MSLVINKPNRVYISSSDSTGYSPNNSRFDITFENPIYFPKSVSLVSAEYSNSFYNIEDTDKFIFYEVYQDTNGVVKGIIKFEIDGIISDHYNATEFATALTNKLNSVELVGVDTDPTLHDDIFFGFVSPSTFSNLFTTPDPTNETFVMKKIIDSTDTNTYLHTKLTIGCRKNVNPQDLPNGLNGYGYIFTESGGNYTFLGGGILNYNSVNYSSFYDQFVLDISSLKIYTTAVNVFVGVVLPNGGNILSWNSPVSTLNYSTIDVAIVDEVVQYFDGFSDVQSINQVLNATLTPTNTLTKEPVMYLTSKPVYNYSYNAVGGATWLKSKLLVSYNTDTKRFSIEPERDSSLTNGSGVLITDNNTVPFFNPAVNYGRTTKVDNLSGYLEVKVENKDKTFINYSIGATSRQVNTISYSNKTSVSPLVMPSIPNLIRFPYIFLTCDFVEDSFKSGKDKFNILQKLPLSNNFGDLTFFNNAGSEASLRCRVSKDQLQTLRFKLLDKDNEEVNLNGGEVSFTLSFTY